MDPRVPCPKPSLEASPDPDPEPQQAPQTPKKSASTRAIHDLVTQGRKPAGNFAENRGKLREFPGISRFPALSANGTAFSEEMPPDPPSFRPNSRAA